MKYSVVISSSAKRTIKKLGRSGSFDPSNLHLMLRAFEEGAMLPAVFKDHRLHGRFSEYRECHIGFDMLVVYKRNEEQEIVTISDIGTHPEIFGE